LHTIEFRFKIICVNTCNEKRQLLVFIPTYKNITNPISEYLTISK
jgi:hypothetical protein